MNDWRSYDEVAETYERVHAPRLAAVARDLAAMTEPPTGGIVLDVGSGTGVAAEAAAALVGEGGSVVGIDPSVGMLVVGHRARPSLLVAAASAIDLPFRDQTFDAVLGNFVLSHFRKVETALFDVKRVVKPGGRLGLTSWSDVGDDLQKTWGELVQTVVPQEMLEPVWAEAAPGHERFARRENVEQVLIDAGFRHVRTEKRQYHFQYAQEDYLGGLETWATGRFVREMLGPTGWEEFRARVRTTFAERFADPLNDFRDVIFAVAARP